VAASRPGADRFRVGAGTIASLVAGRSTYRLIALATTVALLPVWGAERYGMYAAATASFSWLMALVFTGPEKTVLKLLPRAPRTGRLVTGGLLAVLWWLPIPVAAAFVLVLVAGAGERTVLYIGVPAMLVSVGCTQLLVGLHRAHGRLGPDVASFLAMSVAQLLVLAAAAFGGLGPVGFVGAVIVVQVGLNLLLTVALGRPSVRICRRGRFLRRLGVTALYISGTELFLLLSTAVQFTVLAGAAAGAGQVGPLYAVLLAWSAGVNLLIYLLRVFAPRTSLLLAGRAGQAGRARAARLAGFAAAAHAAWLGLVGLAAAASGLLEPATTTGQVVVWVVLLAAKTPAVAVLLFAGFLLENTDATAPRVVGLAAVIGLATASATALLLVPAAGGVGVVVSQTAGELGYALFVAFRARGRG
jgi:hypothetical protein